MREDLIKELLSSQSIGPMSWFTILASLIIAFFFGLIIALIYKYNYKGVMYSSNFALTLMMMTLVTTPVVMCIKESIQLSMGMVGALSIVRFRTAVKEPLDTAYMFWALTMGILLGAGQFFLTLMTLIGVAILITLITKVWSAKLNSYLLVVRMGDSAERGVAQVVGTLRYYKLKSKTVSNAGIEATYEIRVEKQDAFLNRVSALSGVMDATLVAYTGESI